MRQRVTRTFSVFMASFLIVSASGLPAAAGTVPTNLAPEDIQALVQLLNACDSERQACAKANADKDRLIQGQTDLQRQTEGDLKEARKEQSGILVSPTFWFITGIVTAGLIHTLFK